jgi:glucokinase
MFLGVEIGGTKIQVGVGPGDGTILHQWRGRVDIAAQANGIRSQIETAVPAMLKEAGLRCEQIRGIGIGFGGPVDDAARGVLKSHHVAGWDGFPLADWAEATLGWPCAIGNDADVAGLAEALFGAGQGLSPIFYMTIGSGIGGGLIIDQKIYRGAGKGAGEIGHMRVPTPSGPATLESLCSGWSIEQAAEAQFGVRRTCAELSQTTDPEVNSFLNQRWEFLAYAIQEAIKLICPKRIVIGGGVSLMGERLLEPLRRAVTANVFPPFADCYEIVPAALGEDVVVHGALALAKSIV